ncbi:MAG: ATP-binding cassette domain-containing protein [Alphaproteobacteria bacterium]|nr:ATP-binding cassette domain-containing protein [Alphaproteobacteria bacterium]
MKRAFSGSIMQNKTFRPEVQAPEGMSETAQTETGLDESEQPPRETPDPTALGATPPPEIPRSSFISDIVSLFSGKQALARSTIVSSFVINVLGLALPLVMLQVYDRILVNQSVATLGLLMMGLSTAILVEGGLKVIRAYLMSWSATKQNYSQNLEAVRRAVYAPPDRFEKEPANIWMDRFESLDQFNAFTAGQSRLIILDLPFVAIYLTVIFLVAGSLGFVLIGMIGLVVSVILVRAQAMRKVLAEQLKHDSRRDDFIAETLQGIESVKSMAMEPQMQRRFERLQQTNSAISHQSILLNGELQTYSQLIANIVLVSMVTVGAISVINGALSVGTLACCTLLTSRVMQPVMRGIQVIMEIQSAKLAQDNAVKLLDLPSVDLATEGEAVPEMGEIELKSATFTYGGSEKPALQDVSLHVAPGEIVGIRGEHASGKSTLIRLISGEIEPSRGLCRINGKDAHAISHAELSRNMVFVSQDSAIFEGTVMDNISMFRSGPQAIKSAREAAQLIALEDDIHRMPKGYDTPIGQGITHALPRGMVQRITIARALAVNPPILLFDEANSMLDMRSDTALKNGLMQLAGKMTILLISNRPSLLAIANKTYVLKSGVLSEYTPASQSRPFAAAQTA